MLMYMDTNVVRGDASSQVLVLARVRRMPPAERRRIRVEAGVSRADVARGVPCTERAVASWETGKRQPTGAVGARYGMLLSQLANLADTPTDEVTTP